MLQRSREDSERSDNSPEMSRFVAQHGGLLRESVLRVEAKNLRDAYTTWSAINYSVSVASLEGNEPT